MKRISFRISSSEIASVEEYPVPSSTVLPEWFKDVPTQSHRDARVLGSRIALNMKSCVPFLDSLTSGYIKRLSTDVIIRNRDGVIEYYYPGHPVMADREETHLPRINGFIHHEFIWNTYVWPKTPPGYSCIITHPFNRYDLPFITMTGIVDTDRFGALDGGGNLPFMLREGFDGIIPAGTPIYQIIPLKRDEWEHDTGVTPQEQAEDIRAKLRRHFSGAYKRYFWTRKTYR